MNQLIVSAATEIKSDTWLVAANQAVRSYCGWHISPSIRETLVLDGNGSNVLLLPSMKVTEIHSVKINGKDVTDAVQWSEKGMLATGGIFPDKFRSIEIDLTHGFEVEAVADITSLIIQIARRAKVSATTPTNLASQSVNGASVGYLSAGGAHLSTPLLSIEKEALAPYRLAGRIA